MPDDSPSAKHRLIELDGVRGIAALVVVMHHLSELEPSFCQRPACTWSMIFSPFFNGDAAVSLFFVLSGYVLAMPFLQGRPPAYRSFFMKRFCRIYIPFAATIILALFLYGMTLGRLVESPGIIIGHLLMLGPKRDITLDQPMWSLVYEMRLSILFPLLVWLCRDTRRGLAAALLMLAVSTQLLAWCGETRPYWAKSFTHTFLWTIKIAPDFMIGIMLSKHRGIIRRGIAFVSPLKRVALLILSFIIFTTPYHFLSVGSALLYEMAIAIIITMSLEAPMVGRMLKRNVPQWLGHISYSLYLCHLPIILLMRHIFGESVGWMLLTSLAISLAVAALIHRFIEIPAMNLGRKLATSIHVRGGASAGIG